MAVELAVAYISLVPSTRGFAAEANKAIADIATPANKEGTNIGDRLLGGIGSVLSKGALVVGAATATGIGTALWKGFSRLDSLDQAAAKLTGLGHSASTVDQIMENALASVKGTAFGMDEAATSAAGAVAANIKPGVDLERTLKLVADAATIAGSDMGSMGSIFNKVAASGKLQGDVIAQLQDAGIPILQMVASEMGVTAEEAAKMASNGEVSFDTFRNAMEGGLGGSALASGDTFSGAMDNVGAALGRVGANLLSGVFPQLKEGAMGVTEWLAPMEEKAEELGAAFGEFAADAGPKIADVLKFVAEALMNVFTWASNNTGLIQTLGIIAAGALVAFLGYRAITGVLAAVKVAQLAFTAATYGQSAATYGATAATKLQTVALNAGKVAAYVSVGAQKALALAQAGLQKANIRATASVVAGKVAQIGAKVATVAGTAVMGAATAAQWAFNAALSANPLTLIILAVIALVGALIWFFTQTELGKEIWANISQFFIDTWNNIVKFAEGLWNGLIEFFSGLWENVTGFFADAWTNITKGIEDAWNGVLAFFDDLWANIGRFFEEAVAFIMDIFLNWTPLGLIIKNWDEIVAFFGDVWANIVGFFNTALETISIIWNTVWGAISGFFMMIWDGIVGFVTWYINLVLDIIENVVEFIVTVWNDTWQGISDFFSEIWDGIVSFVEDVIENVRDTIESVVTKISTIWNELWQGISDFFSGIWDGIVDAVGKFGKTFEDIFGGIRKFVDEAFANVLGAVKTPINGLIDLINGAIDGLNSIKVEIPSWLADITGVKGSFSLNIPRIPRLAAGGIVSRRPGGILANIGEGRYDEAVVPLTPDFLNSLGQGPPSSSTPAGPITISTGETDPTLLARKIARELLNKGLVGTR